MDIHPTLQAEFDSLKAEIDLVRTEMRQEISTLLQKIEDLRLQVVTDATPETPVDVFAAVPGIGAKAEEFAPVTTQSNPAPAPVIEMPAPTPTPVENGVTVLQETTEATAPEIPEVL